MADYYLRHGEYPVYAAVPTGASWPLDAQDGDGLSPDMAVSAVASIDFTGITSVAGETLGIMGATLTAAASPAVNQFGVLTGAALATSVAAAINAATATVNTGTSAALPQLRDMVYARVNPGVSTQVQIMTRPGSATLNHATNSFVAIVESLSGAPTIVQFAGGVSGAWGYLWNAPPEGTASTATIWPSAKAINTYGVVFSAAAARPLAGPVITFNDTVNQRGNDAVLSSGTSTSNTTVSITSQLNLLVDDGTIWAGATGAVTVVCQLSGAATFSVTSSCPSSLPCRPISLSAKTSKKLIFELGGTTTAGFSIAFGNTGGAGTVIQRALFNETTVSASAKFVFASPNGGATFMLRIVSSYFRFTRNYFYGLVSFYFNKPVYAEFVDDVFEWTALATAPAELFNLGTLNGSVFKAQNCQAIGASPRLFAMTPNISTYLSAKNMKGFALGDTLIGLLGSSSIDNQDVGNCLLQNVGANRAMRLETNTSVLDWNPAGGYPTLHSSLPNGTPWAYRLLLSASENATRYGANVELLSFTKTFENGSNAVATLTLELLVPGAYAASITTGHLALLVAYTDASGLQQFEKVNWSVTPRQETTALTASEADWTLNDYGAHVPRKIVCTTGSAVKVNTEIEVSLMLRRVMPAQVEIFVDPDMVIAA